MCGNACVDLSNDPMHCGNCTKTCATGEFCSSSACTAECVPPNTVCGALCTNLKTDPGNCGMCGEPCFPSNVAAATCSGGACGYTACQTGFSDCNGKPEDGCEASTSGDVFNCGGCGVVCRPLNVTRNPPNPDAGMVDAGTDAGVADAGTVDAGICGPLADGGSGGLCPPAPGAACVASACTYERCQAGFADCDGVLANGCEADLGGDRENCGKCGFRCDAPGQFCSQGICYGNKVSVVSPDNQVFTAGSYRSMHHELAAEPGGTIYYTTDGNLPIPGAANTTTLAPGVVAGFDNVGFTLRWYTQFADGTREPLRSFELYSSGPNCVRGGIIEYFKFNSSNSPIAVVTRGSTVAGTFNQQYWTSDNTAGCYCPFCASQWVLSSDGVGQVECVTTGFPNTYPGMSVPSSFSFTAPATPGRYYMRWGVTDQFGCSTAGAPGGTQVGLLIVQ
jgi:hypothetical protein